MDCVGNLTSAATGIDFISHLCYVWLLGSLVDEFFTCYCIPQRVCIVTSRIYTIVWKTFVIKNRMASPLQNLNTRILFHYEFFAVDISI